MKVFREIKVMFKMVGESTKFAFSSLKVDKLRTFLSLLGVSVGIFAIIAIFTTVDAIQNNINSGLSALGGDVIYIQQFPFSDDSEESDESYRWWDYIKRPAITYKDFQFVLDNFTEPADIVYYSSIETNVFYFREEASDVTSYVSSVGLENVISFELSDGRLISEFEYSNGSPVAVLGYELAHKLFGEYESPLGKTIKIGKYPVKIVGLIEKQGQGMVQAFDLDNSLLLPVNYAQMISRTVVDYGTIMVNPPDGIDKADFKAELKKVMRSLRRLSPTESDNFALNEISFLADMFSQVFVMVNMLGWIIGSFSLLIGGFGIANIMFVSVKEKTNQIGIQKALGAKNYIILVQYLVESAVLSITGGVVGVLLVFIGVSIVGSFNIGGVDFEITMSFINVLKGLLVSAIIGIISGISPAYSAAKLNPVEAISHS